MITAYAIILTGVELHTNVSDSCLMLHSFLLQAIETDEHGRGLMRSKAFAAIDRGIDVSDDQLLRLFADPTSATLLGRRERLALPEGIALLEKTERIDLSNCKMLRELPCSFCVCVCPAQQDLHMAGFENQCGCMCTNLQVLDLRACHSLTTLPSPIGNLASLRMLDLGDCWSLTSLPESIGSLGSLQALRLYMPGGFESTSKLTHLPESIGNLTALKTLDLRHCRTLRALPEAVCRLASLEKLMLQGCEGLSTLPDELGDLQALQKLDVTACRGLVELPASMCNLQRLQLLKLDGDGSVEQDHTGGYAAE